MDDESTPSLISPYEIKRISAIQKQLSSNFQKVMISVSFWSFFFYLKKGKRKVK